MEEKVFYFVDTRKNAKTDGAFGITNHDVAKSWVRDYNMGEGPFKPVEAPIAEEGSGVVTKDAEFAPNFQVNRRDLQQAGVNETPVQIEATEHNLEVVNDEEKTVYDGMSKAELTAELDAREIDYKKSGPESTNEAYIKLLVSDDKE